MKIKKGINRLKNVKPEVWLILILILAVVLRLYFFVGLINADPQDDGIYIFSIKDIVEGKYDIQYLKNLVKEETINPVHTFKLRNGFLFPEAFFVGLLGFNQLGYTFYPLLCSLLSIILVYFFGKIILKNEKVGLISSFFLAIYPLDVIFSTKISPEVPLGFFVSLSLYFLVVSLNQKRKKIIYPLLSGVFAGIATTIKTFGIILFPVIGLLIIYYFIKNSSRKKIMKLTSYFTMGFLLIFLINSIYFYINTGQFLLEPIVNRKAQMDNFKGAYSKHKITENLNVLTIFGEPIEYFKLIFGSKESRPGVNYFGYFYFLFFPSLVFLLLKKRIRKKITFIAIWFLVGILILEFFPVGIQTEFNPDIKLNYLMIPKQARFMNVLTIPTILILALAITSIKESNFQKFFIIVVILFLGFTSLIHIFQIHSYFKDGIRDTEEISKLIPVFKKTIYTDHLAKGEINYFTGFKYEDKIKDFSGIQNKTQINNSYIIVGGARGVDIYWKVVLDLIPDFLHDAVKNGNDNFVLIKEIEGINTGYRKYNLKVYYVP